MGTANLYAVTSGDFDNNGQCDVAVGGDDSKITAINGANGATMWECTAPGAKLYRKCLGAADLNGDGAVDVVAGSDDNFVYAINGLNGNILWSVELTADIEEIEVVQIDKIGAKDVAAVCSGDPGGVYLLEGETGDTLWTYKTDTRYSNSIEILDANDDGYMDVAIGVPYSGGRLLLIDGLTHTELWRVDPFMTSSDYALSHGDLNLDKRDELIAGGEFNRPVRLCL